MTPLRFHWTILLELSSISFISFNMHSFCTQNGEKKDMNKKKFGLAALTLTLCISIVFATGYFLISNRITETATVARTDLIEITVEGFPTDIEFGKNYNFTVVTENLADQELTGLQSFITIQYNDTNGSPKYLDTNWLYIYYNDSGFDGIAPWEGEIQGSFEWVYPYLLSENKMGNGNWTAPVGYKNTATVTFRIEACAPLPDGTLTWEAWVNAPLLP